MGEYQEQSLQEPDENRFAVETSLHGTGLLNTPPDSGSLQGFVEWMWLLATDQSRSQTQTLAISRLLPHLAFIKANSRSGISWPLWGHSPLDPGQQRCSGAPLRAMPTSVYSSKDCGPEPLSRNA